MKCGTYVTNTIYNILLLGLYFIHPNLHRRGFHWVFQIWPAYSFLAYVAENPCHLYATGYSSWRLGFCLHLKTAISARFLCNRENLGHADLESGSSHFRIGFCASLWRGINRSPYSDSKKLFMLI